LGFVYLAVTISGLWWFISFGSPLLELSKLVCLLVRTPVFELPVLVCPVEFVYELAGFVSPVTMVFLLEYIFLLVIELPYS
jgi:hypothetical protein